MSSKKTIIIVDDNKSFLNFLKEKIEKKFNCFDVEIYEDFSSAIKSISDSLDLLILDWELEKIDGKKILEFALKSGIPYHKIVIISSRSSEELHNNFKQGEVLSVINKTDPNQINALFMILENISCY